MEIVFGFLILLGLFLIGRDVVCWYFKINERTKIARETLAVLKEIRDKGKV